MKKILVVFLLSYTFAAPVFALCGSIPQRQNINWTEQPDCRGNPALYWPFRGVGAERTIRAHCRAQNASTNNPASYAQGARVLYDIFPWVGVCDRGFGTAAWQSRIGLCPGYSHYAWLQSTWTRNTSNTGNSPTQVARAIPIAVPATMPNPPSNNNTQVCWRWECNGPGVTKHMGGTILIGGHHRSTGGICQTFQEFCESRGLRVNAQANGCEVNWCEGWNTCGANQDRTLVGDCYQCRCRAADRWFIGNANLQHTGDRACGAAANVCTPVHRMTGGCIVDDINGTTFRCTSNQFSYQLPNSTWECRTRSTATASRIQQCWACRTMNDLRECLGHTGPPCPQ